VKWLRDPPLPPFSPGQGGDGDEDPLPVAERVRTSRPVSAITPTAGGEATPSPAAGKFRQAVQPVGAQRDRGRRRQGMAEQAWRRFWNRARQRVSDAPRSSKRSQRRRFRLTALRAVNEKPARSRIFVRMMMAADLQAWIVAGRLADRQRRRGLRSARCQRQIDGRGKRKSRGLDKPSLGRTIGCVPDLWQHGMDYRRPFCPAYYIRKGKSSTNIRRSWISASYGDFTKVRIYDVCKRRNNGSSYSDSSSRSVFCYADRKQELNIWPLRNRSRSQQRPHAGRQSKHIIL
jgi:hypothetical protein